MTTKLRVGLAGAGWVMTARHLPAFAGHHNVDVVAVYDRTIERADALAAKAGAGTKAYDNLDAFLSQGLDIVSIATSPWSHHDIAIASLEAGAHVFTEKPMAMDSAEALHMSDVANDAGRLLCVSHNFLFSHSVQRAESLLAGTPIDYVAGVQFSSEQRRLPTWYRDLPGGLMFDEAPHMLYCMNRFLGGSLRLDHARADFSTDGHPRTVELLLRGNTGAGQVTMVFCAPVSEWHLTLSTQRRVVGLDLFRDIAVGISSDGRHGPLDIARTSTAALGGHLGGFVRSGARLVTRRQFWGHDVVIRRFVDATTGRCESPVPIRDSLNVVELTDTVIEALSLRAKSRA
jgi:predicted dehydrogenase